MNPAINDLAEWLCNLSEQHRSSLVVLQFARFRFAQCRDAGMPLDDVEYAIDLFEASKSPKTF